MNNKEYCFSFFYISLALSLLLSSCTKEDSSAYKLNNKSTNTSGSTISITIDTTWASEDTINF